MKRDIATKTTPRQDVYQANAFPSGQDKIKGVGRIQKGKENLGMLVRLLSGHSNTKTQGAMCRKNSKPCLCTPEGTQIKRKSRANPKKHITALLIKVTIPKATTRILPYVKKAALALFVCTREARKTKNKLSLVKPMTRKAHMAFISLSKQAKQKHLILLHNLFWNGLNQVFRKKGSSAHYTGRYELAPAKPCRSRISQKNVNTSTKN